jgi:hypothetical protein
MLDTVFDSKPPSDVYRVLKSFGKCFYGNALLECADSFFCQSDDFLSAPAVTQSDVFCTKLEISALA